jgi:hypothetical protein
VLEKGKSAVSAVAFAVSLWDHWGFLHDFFCLFVCLFGLVLVERVFRVRVAYTL